MPDIAWGNHTRVILDVGCGVASFGGYIFDKEVITMSFAPKDEHEAQIQLALERGIPAISAVMGTQRLPFPSNVFDAVHCARCRVPWHVEGRMSVCFFPQEELPLSFRYPQMLPCFCYYLKCPSQPEIEKQGDNQNLQNFGDIEEIKKT